MEFPTIRKEVPNEEDILEDFGSQSWQAIYESLSQFKNSEPGSRQSWPLVPFGRLNKIWKDYMKHGFVRDVKGMEAISSIMIQNVHNLAANTYLSGHTSSDPSYYFDEAGMDEEAQERYYDYITDEDGGYRLSDYAMDDLQNDAFELAKTFDPNKQLQIVDRMLNRIHRRGDLSAFFIEGGKKSLDRIFNG